MLKTQKEEYIVYDNNVVKTIDTQLKGLPMDKIREKKDMIMEKSIDEIQESIAKKELTYTELTAFYMDRIKTYDKAKKGLNAVMEINPKAIEEAKKLDNENAAGKNKMYGIPVLLKDNINTKDMNTSGGTIALKDFKPIENAPFVDTLIKNKAIILGKSNLSELANYFDTSMPSGYSSKIGQTHNPFGPIEISPLGSSSGSGAAVASNLSAVAIGTETTGSIISPSYIQSIVGFKPTKDAIDLEGVIPLSSSMDTVGPMAKSVKDAVALFNASVADDSKKIELTYKAEDLKNKRIGVFKSDDSQKVSDALKKAGAEPVEIDLDDKTFENDFIVGQEFVADFAEYAKKYNTPVKSIQELVKFNEKDEKRRAKYGQNLLETAIQVKNPDRQKIEKMVKDSKDYINKTMKDNDVEAIAFLNETNVEIPAIAGYPVVTVPYGEDSKKTPTGITFFGLENEDEKLMNIGYAFEQATKMRVIPKKYLETVGK